MLRVVVGTLPSFVVTLSLLLLVASTVSDASAQQADAAIFVGTIVDSSDGALPGATITVTHLATNVTAVAVANDRGQYRTPPLRPGAYDIVIELQGFKRFLQQGVVVNIGDVRTVHATLEVGSLSESVTVAASAPLLSSGDSTLGTVITSDQIEALPLNGRDYLQLASLSSGTGPQTAEGVIIGGQGGHQVAFLLDGQDNNNQQIRTGHSGQKEVVKPSIDAIEEFKVVTNGYSAEYGRSSSGVVSVSLKGGSNQLRGALFEFFRDDAFDARNFFSNTKPDLNRHQFGTALGFPLLRNRTFFFGDFEQTVIRREETQVSTLPAAGVRGGVFPTAIRDPLTGQPFPNNAIPANRIDPVSQRLLQYIPLPQTSDAANNFTYNSPQDRDVLKWNARVDHVVDQGHNFYVRYSNQTSKNAPFSPLPPDAQGNFVVDGYQDISRNHALGGVYNGVWSPTLISSVRLGWNYIDWDETVPEQPLTGLGIPGVDNTLQPFGQISISGYRGLGIQNTPNADDSSNLQLSGDITWTTGAHTLKTGIQSYRLGTDFFAPQQSAGIFSFNGNFTGDAFADFLLGYASSASLSKWAILNFRTWYHHAFVQDDWRIGRRLTLNLGLRYELSLPPVDVNDAIGNFDLDTDPEHPRLVVPDPSGGRRARSLQGLNARLFAPRLGFAYSLPGDLTVVRGGAGIFYSNMETFGGMSSLEINPPHHIRVAATTDPQVPSIFLSRGFADNALDPAFARNVTLISWDRRDRQPTAYQWNVNVQRELPGRVLVEAGYAANRLVNAWRSYDANYAAPGPGNVASRRRFQTATWPGTDTVFTLSNISRHEKNGWSQYHALQTKVEKRYSRGTSLLASYTWSKTRGLAGGYQDPTNLEAEVGPLSTDRPHHLVASGTYELPFGRGRTFGGGWGSLANAVLGGWAFSPIVTATAGAPLNFTVNGNPSNSTGTDRPNLVGDWRVDDPTVDRWFNTEAFARPAQFTFGDTPKGLVRGPGYFNVDVVIRKSFRASDRLNVDLRFESFNATNHVNLGNPNTTLGNAAFGRVSSAGVARNNQVAVKLQF